MSHDVREHFAARHPLHVTLRIKPGVPSLRRGKVCATIRAALTAGGHKPTFRVVEFNALHDHLHLLVEADGPQALARGMQGLQVRLARRINRLLERTGSLFATRYHARALRTPREVRNALRRYSEFYRTNTIKQYMAGNRKQRQWVIMGAQEQGLMPTTEAGLAFRTNITMALDGYSGVEHNLPITPLYDDVIKLFAASGTVSTPTLLVTYGGPWVENYYYTKENPNKDPKLRRFTPDDDLDDIPFDFNANFAPSPDDQHDAPF